MKVKTVKAYAKRLAKLELDLQKNSSNYDKCKEIEKNIESITKQYMVLARNDMNAIFELDFYIQKMLTKQ